MNRRRRKNNNYTTYIMVGVAAVLLAVLLVVLLTQCGGGGSPDGGQSGSNSPPPAPPVAVSPSQSSPAAPPPPNNTSPAGQDPAPSSSDSGSGSSDSDSEVLPQPPPAFVDGKVAVKLDEDGETATVTYKTNVESTVNAILATSGEGISTGQFYDYFNRARALDGAVSKTQTYMVTSGGKDVSFDLPDPTKTYYLYLNAVENQTGVWQTGVTVILLREGDPDATPPDASSVSASDTSSGSTSGTTSAA